MCKKIEGCEWGSLIHRPACLDGFEDAAISFLLLLMVPCAADERDLPAAILVITCAHENELSRNNHRMRMSEGPCEHPWQTC